MENTRNLNENEFEILRIITFEECLDYSNSIDSKTLSTKCNLSTVYIRKILTRLKEYSFLEEGIKKGNARTYFVTPLGYEYVFNILFKSSNKEIENMKNDIKLIKGSEEDELNEE